MTNLSAEQEIRMRMFESGAIPANRTTSCADIIKWIMRGDGMSSPTVDLQRHESQAVGTVGWLRDHLGGADNNDVVLLGKWGARVRKIDTRPFGDVNLHLLYTSLGDEPYRVGTVGWLAGKLSNQTGSKDVVFASNCEAGCQIKAVQYGQEIRLSR